MKFKNVNINDNFDKFDEVFNSFKNKISKIDKKIINIWYRKTLINQFKSSNKILKVLNSGNFCEHILKSIKSNKEILIKKTKLINENELLGRKKVREEEEEEKEYDGKEHFI